MWFDCKLKLSISAHLFAAQVNVWVRQDFGGVPQTAQLELHVNLILAALVPKLFRFFQGQVSGLVLLFRGATHHSQGKIRENHVSTFKIWVWYIMHIVEATRRKLRNRKCVEGSRRELGWA